MTGFGPRYGKKIRNITSKIEKTTKASYKCPSCSRTRVKRESVGVWKCRKCGIKIASGAYEFKEKKLR